MILSCLIIHNETHLCVFKQTLHIFLLVLHHNSCINLCFIFCIELKHATRGKKYQIQNKINLHYNKILNPLNFHFTPLHSSALHLMQRADQFAIMLCLTYTIFNTNILKNVFINYCSNIALIHCSNIALILGHLQEVNNFFLCVRFICQLISQKFYIYDYNYNYNYNSNTELLKISLYNTKLF